MKEDMKEYLATHRVPFRESFDSADGLKDFASQADILYITQIPPGHFGQRGQAYAQAQKIFRIHPDILKALKKDTSIIHPFPRNQELPREVDPDPRAIYFRALEWGQFLRMGLLCHVLGVWMD